MVINFVKFRLKLMLHRYCWRIKNKHNSTSLKTLTPYSQISVGINTYGDLNINSSNYNSKLIIGNYCSIASEVTFLLNSEHPINNISTYPFKVKIIGSDCESLSKGDIIVDDDVWIGHRAIIMSGVHIGQGAVIGAGAVVTRDIPPYAVVAGVPAKIMKMRFNEDVVSCLLDVDFSKLSENLIKTHICDLYTILDSSEQLHWLPKKSKNV